VSLHKATDRQTDGRSAKMKPTAACFKFLLRTFLKNGSKKD